MSANLNYISIDTIANNIYKNPLLKSLNFEDIIDYTLSVLKILRMDNLYENYGCFVKIENYKGGLKGYPIKVLTVDKVVNNNKKIPMVVSNSHTNFSNKNSDTNSYTIRNKVIHTDFERGTVFVVFTSLILDEDGLPMIPDSEALLRAIQAHIKAEVYSVMNDLGKLPRDSYMDAKQEYLFYIGQAENEFKDFINEDDREAFLRDWTRPIPVDSNHRTRGNINTRAEYVRII